MAEKNANDISCYSTSLLIEYARVRGVDDDTLFEGVSADRAMLRDSMAWTDVFTWSRLAANIAKATGGEPGTLERMGEELSLGDIRDDAHFQLLFLRMAPLPELVRRLSDHVRRYINRNLVIRLEKTGPGEAHLHCQPIVPSRYTEEICAFNRGTALGLMKLKGYDEASIEEVSCCIEQGTNECHYTLRWNPRSGMLRRAGTFVLYHLRGQRAIIRRLEQHYDELRRQYEDSRRVEAALRRSEARFRAVFENILDVYYETTQDGRILELSPSAEQLFGHSRSTLYGMYLSELYVDPAERERMLAQLTENGTVADYEVHLRHESGEVLTCSITAAHIHDAEGHPYKIAGTIRDISARKKAETVLKQSEERLRCVVQNMPVMLAAFDERNRVVAWNQECEKVTGYSQSDIVGNSAAMRLLFPDHEERRKALATLDEWGLNYRNRELGIRSKDGARRTILMSNISEQFPISGWASWVVGHDITERKKAEQAVRESETRFRELADNIEEVFWLCSPDWSEMYYVSPTFATIWGVPEVQLYGSPSLMHDSVHWDDRVRFDEYCRGVLDGSVASESACEYRIIQPNGAEKWISARIYPVHDEHWQVIRLAGVAVDVTEQHRAAEERAVMEEQLRQAQKMDAVGQLAGGIAHDFNNQLAGIMGFAELLRDELGTDSRLASYVDYVLLGSRRAAELTAKLLAFARKGKYQTVPVNVHKVIAEVVSLLEHSIDKRIKIMQTLSASPPIAMGDPTQIQNAILNLGLNARDAMPDGGTLSIDTAVVGLDAHACRNLPFDLDPGPFIRISVKDTGIGIPPGVKERMFEPFFTTKTEGKGTGMGLPSVYGAVRNHRGAVTVESEEGKGTDFSVFLPVAGAEGESSVGADHGAVYGNATVMVVDDEETFRDMAVATLTSLGYKTVTCPDGAAAIEYYRHAWRDIDLVMLDMVMPELDGQQTYEKLREINADVRVLLCSGYSVDGRAQHLLRNGARGFIEKPFRKAELSRKLSDALSG
ncbi:MAG: PAS domain S-box protein [Chitinivibrionales bacterium]|nr:PAS domain S-box protein [Chitinivibrionales bacterium]